jgi:hypothetical protein
MSCGAVVTNVYEAYEAGKRAALEQLAEPSDLPVAAWLHWDGASCLTPRQKTEGECTSGHSIPLVRRSHAVQAIHAATPPDLRPHIAAIHCRLQHGGPLTEAARLALVDECEAAAPELKALRAGDKGAAA